MMATIISPSHAALRLTENASLATRNTFQVAANTGFLAEIESLDGLFALLDCHDFQSLPFLVLGEGSNLLFTRDWPGLIIHLTSKGIQILSAESDTFFVRAEAGERWHDLVQWCVERDLRGIENLALIPGTVGAAPIQNIGAYGVELSDVLHTVEVWNFEQKKLHQLKSSECNLAYRTSLFKQHPGRYLITAIELKLSRSKPLKIDYAGIKEELVALNISQPNEQDIFQIVCRLRRKKLPDPAIVGNAGSFFKNPVVTIEIAQQLQREHPTLPVYPANSEQAKLSAAWLIERCGWKGFREGDAGVSIQHALVLVNYEKATGKEIWQLAQRIQESVKERFGIALEPEPRVI